MKLDTSKYKAKNLGLRYGAIKGIVLHDTAGAGTENDVKYLATDPEHRNISVDFVVLRDGQIYQLNPYLDSRCTFHAGRNTKFKSMVNASVNQGTVGIEISQKANIKLSSPIWPREQVEAVAELCVWLCSKFRLEKTDITTHAKIITDGTRTDPRLFPFDEFWAYFNGHAVVSDQNPETQNTSLASKIFHTVQTGDTLTDIAHHYHKSIEELKVLNSIENENLIHVGQKLQITE